MSEAIKAADKFIPLSVPNLAGNELKYVTDCIESGWVSSVGLFVARFEEALAKRVGTKYAVATSSGTAAIHTALIVCGVQYGDEVLMPTLTFIAPANAVRYVGAWPVFIDAEEKHFQIDLEKLESFLCEECEFRDGKTFNKRTCRKIAAVIPVHVLGHPCDMDRLMQIAEKWQIAVVEDATESLGSRWGNRSTGSIGHIGCFSFNGNKIITTGGGGMLATNDKVLAAKARYLTTQAKDNEVEFIHGAIGYNYRLNNIQAAVGCAQLERLEIILERKREIADRYSRAFKSIPGLMIPIEAPLASSNWWLYTIRIDPEKVRSRSTSRQILAALQSSGIQCRPLWQPMHLSPAHAKSEAWKCSTANILWQQCLSLPCSSNLEDYDQDRVVNAVQISAG
jgi:perosamine synthetase